MWCVYAPGNKIETDIAAGNTGFYFVYITSVQKDFCFKKSNLLSVNILTETKRHAGQKAASVSQPIPPNIAPSIRTAAQAIT